MFQVVIYLLVVCYYGAMSGERSASALPLPCCSTLRPETSYARRAQRTSKGAPICPSTT